MFQAVITRGGRFLEVPVIGSKQLAKDGQLVVIAAGDRTLYDDCQSCLQAMARHMFYIGQWCHSFVQLIPYSQILASELLDRINDSCLCSS